MTPLRMPKVFRRPSPVILRQRGYNSAMSSYISLPTSVVFGSPLRSVKCTGLSLPLWQKIWVTPVPLGNGSLAGWPGDIESGVVPPHPAGVFGGVKLRHLVEDLGLVCQRLKPMGEAFGDVKHLAIVRRQFHSHPLREGRRIGPQVDDHVINRPPGA